MEWFLLLVILAVLFINFSKNKTRQLRTEELLHNLHKKVNALQEELHEKSVVRQ